MPQLKNLNLEQVKNLAVKLAQEHIKKDLVIGLVGPLGSGKTTFTKSFAKELKINSIKSPTFIVTATHFLKPDKKFYHVDLYRLNKKSDLNNIGIEEILNEKKRIALIEWADKFPSVKKQCDLIIEFKLIDSKTRNVTIHQN